jgi:PqqD family protein of HPr-rel-A system
LLSKLLFEPRVGHRPGRGLNIHHTRHQDLSLNHRAEHRYRALVQAAVWRRWGDELAVYEGRSARTHLLTDGHAELFILLADNSAPMSLRDIERQFEADDDVRTAPALSDSESLALRTLVDELVTLGLVEAVPAGIDAVPA